MPPARANTFGPTMHVPASFQQQQQGGHPMGTVGVGGAGGMHNQLMDGNRYAQQQQLYNAQAQAAAAAAVQRGNQQLQQQVQQQAQQQAQAAQQSHLQQQQNLLGLINRNAGNVSAGLVGRPINIGPGVVQNLGLDGRPIPQTAAETQIRDVWAEDLNREMGVLRSLVDKFPYIAMDTEFPGIVARPIGQFKSKADYHYQTLRCNVDMLKIIQLGITLADESGELAKVDGAVCTWQFNFKFSLNDDMYAQESIDLLTKSGIDFVKHATQGIDVYAFGDLLISSGLVMLDEVKWISFHSGYDFGYLVKIMSCKPLPTEESEFRTLLGKYFPALYDIKFLMKSCRSLKGGLQDIAEDMGVARVGPQHQAGSDSLLTGNIFFEMRERFFEGRIDDSKFLGQVWGLNGAGISPPNINGAGTVVYKDGIPVPSTPTNASASANVNANGSREGAGTPTGTTTPGRETPHIGRGMTPGTPSFYGKMGGM